MQLNTVTVIAMDCLSIQRVLQYSPDVLVLLVPDVQYLMYLFLEFVLTQTNSEKVLQYLLLILMYLQSCC